MASVFLKAIGEKKINAIKLIREIYDGPMGLKEAKDLVESVYDDPDGTANGHKLILSGITEFQAAQAVQMFENIGTTAYVFEDGISFGDKVQLFDLRLALSKERTENRLLRQAQYEDNSAVQTEIQTLKDSLSRAQIDLDTTISDHNLERAQWTVDRESWSNEKASLENRLRMKDDSIRWNKEDLAESNQAKMEAQARAQIAENSLVMLERVHALQEKMIVMLEARNAELQRDLDLATGNYSLTDKEWTDNNDY